MNVMSSSRFVYPSFFIGFIWSSIGLLNLSFRPQSGSEPGFGSFGSRKTKSLYRSLLALAENNY